MWKQKKEHRRKAKWWNRSTSQEETRGGKSLPKGREPSHFFLTKPSIPLHCVAASLKMSSCLGACQASSQADDSLNFREFCWIPWNSLNPAGFPFSVRIPAKLGGLADRWLVLHAAVNLAAEPGPLQSKFQSLVPLTVTLTGWVRNP